MSQRRAKEWSENTADESDILNLEEKKNIGVDGQKGKRPQGKHTEAWGVRAGDTCAVRCLQITTRKEMQSRFLNT